jgi:hypothetical protein
MRRTAQEGWASAVALVALVLLAALATGGAQLLRGLRSYQARSAVRGAARTRLWRAGRETVALLAADPTPQADSMADPVWLAVASARDDGVAVEISDLSSSLNPNWIRASLFTRTALADLLAPQAGAEAIRQRQEERGLSLDIIGGYGDLFREGMLERYFSGYGYANVNTTDELALRALYLLGSDGAAGAEELCRRVRQAATERRIIRREELAGFLGDAYSRLRPVVNAEPALNVHFAEAFVLRALLGDPVWGIADPDKVARTLEDRRKRGELTAAELILIVGVDAGNGIYQYLGVTTWFWSVAVVAAGGEERLDLVVARLPEETEGRPRFVIVEERYAR